MKNILSILGFIFFLLALIGVFIPLLPTTPFALLALYFFGRSSPKFYGLCMNIPGVEVAVKDWKEHRMIRRRVKLKAVFLISISAVVILLRDSIPMAAKAAAILILIFVSCFLLSVSSTKK